METECAKMRGREPVLIPSQGRLRGMGRPNDVEKPYRCAYWKMKTMPSPLPTYGNYIYSEGEGRRLPAFEGSPTKTSRHRNASLIKLSSTKMEGT